jgi:hypothetical protein
MKGRGVESTGITGKLPCSHAIKIHRDFNQVPPSKVSQGRPCRVGGGMCRGLSHDFPCVFTGDSLTWGLTPV